MYTLGDTSSALLPIKFVLIFAQNILVYVIYKSTRDFTYSEIGTKLSTDDEESRENELKYGCYAIWVLCYFELFMMIIGSSVPFVFAKFNLLQNVLHFLGCLFTLWFILDTWSYYRIWYVFMLTSILPFILEVMMFT